MEENTICGLNVIGLRRAGIAAADRQDLKQAYRLLFRGGLNRVAAIAAARSKCSSEVARALIDFVEHSKKGVCADVGFPGAGEESGESV
jgi:UDP-N-acetylglucosamine acyltransferase